MQWEVHIDYYNYYTRSLTCGNRWRQIIASVIYTCKIGPYWVVFFLHPKIDLVESNSHMYSHLLLDALNRWRFRVCFHHSSSPRCRGRWFFPPCYHQKYKGNYHYCCCNQDWLHDCHVYILPYCEVKWKWIESRSKKPESSKKQNERQVAFKELIRWFL